MHIKYKSHLKKNLNSVNEEKDDDNKEENSITSVEYVRIKALKTDKEKNQLIHLKMQYPQIS